MGDGSYQFGPIAANEKEGRARNEIVLERGREDTIIEFPSKAMLQTSREEPVTQQKRVATFRFRNSLVAPTLTLKQGTGAHRWSCDVACWCCALLGL